MQTYEQGQVCYLTGEHGEAVKHVYLGSRWVPMSAEMESVIKILDDRYSARDAEWQARVDTLLEDNARSEEQVKKQFANAVSFKARAEKAEAQEEKLKAALKNLLYTAEKLWDDAKPIKDSEIVRATHPIIEQARAALGR